MHTTVPECLPEERQRMILGRLAHQGRVVAAELAREFKTSEDTIRRDLRELAAAGLCKRVYGGALPVSPASGPLNQREQLAPQRKQMLGETLASLVTGNQVVFIDAGSTNLAAVRALPEGQGITVVTNAPSIGAALTERSGIELVMTGGLVDHRTGAAFGARALRDVADIRPDVYLLGACSLDADAGIAAFGFDESEFKRTVAGLAATVMVAVTNDKLGTSAPYRVAGSGVVADLVVEHDAPEEALIPLHELGICIHRANPAKEA